MPIEPLDICVLFDTVDTPTGGGNQFLKALIAEFRRRGLHVTTRPTARTQVVLLNGFNQGTGRPLKVRKVERLRRTGQPTILSRGFARRQRKPVLVHRVDGVPHLTRGKKTKADIIQPAVNALTDHTIFQSDFCRTSFHANCDRAPKSWRVVKNAVDPRVFFLPDQPCQLGRVLSLVATSWSPNPSKGFSTLAAISRLPGVQLTFAGNWCPDIDPAKTRLVGTLHSVKLAELLRSSDAMVHAAVNEPCSNSIVEALACGLPVMYRDSGGNRELAGDYGVALTEDLEETVATLTSRWPSLREKVIDHRPRFLIPRAAEEYLVAFQDTIKHHDANDA